MTEAADRDAPEDEVRQHAESEAEGPDDTQDADIPREHAEDPAEG